MTTSWPEHALDESSYKDVFHLAEIFELHCAKVYDHAATHPDDAASADYVMQLVSQAYRAVHSLHMQTIASKYLEMGAATAALESKAIEYREGRGLSSADENHTVEVETADEAITNTPSFGLEDLLNGDFEDDDEEDSNWEESGKETDDEYYEYSEGSDSDSELDEMAKVPRTEQALLPLAENKQVDDQPLLGPNNATEIQKPITKDTIPPPPASIIQDQATHDKITAALRRLSLPCNEPEEIPLARVETHIDRPMTKSSAAPLDITRSEATAVPTESGQELPLKNFITAPVSNSIRDPSLDASRLRRKLSMRSSPRGLPRRLKTVCHKYVGRHFT